MNLVTPILLLAVLVALIVLISLVTRIIRQTAPSNNSSNSRSIIERRAIILVREIESISTGVSMQEVEFRLGTPGRKLGPNWYYELDDYSSYDVEFDASDKVVNVMLWVR